MLIQIVDGAVSIKPTSKPEIGSYAMNEILPDKDKRKNEKEDIKVMISEHLHAYVHTYV